MTGVVFFLAAIFSYLKDKRVWAVLFALFAFFTYEMTLTLPLIFVLYEGITHRKVNKNVEKYFNLIGIIFILGLAILISINDIIKFYK